MLPIDDGLKSRIFAMEPPLWPVPRRLVLRPGFGPLADEVVPSLGGGSRLEADVEVPAGGGQGVLAAMGDWTNGWALVVLDGRPVFLLNVTSTPSSVRAEDVLSPGRHRIGFRFVPDGHGGGRGVLSVDGSDVANRDLPDGVGASGMQIGGGGLRLGHDAGFPVSDDYRPPFPWSGVLHQVVFDSSPPSRDQQANDLADTLRTE